MADILAAEAAAHPSFAGPFAYERNTPTKVFAGDAAVIPPDVLAQALASNRGDAVMLSSIPSARNCSRRCQQGFDKCVRTGKMTYGSDVPSDVWEACRLEATTTCLSSCLGLQGPSSAPAAMAAPWS